MTVLREPGPPPETTSSDGRASDLDGAELAALRAIATQLHAAFPARGVDVVEAVLMSCYRRTAGARVQNYRLVLAERAARDTLAGAAWR